MGISFEEMCLFALSPLDGRYHRIQQTLSPFLSEWALYRYRVDVETSWLRYQLTNIPKMIDPTIKAKYDSFNSVINLLHEIVVEFSNEDALEIKELEKQCGHDERACELFVANKLSTAGFGDLASYVHIGCTSDDITNIAYAQMIDSAMREVILPALHDTIIELRSLVDNYAAIPMLSFTQGQPATPTTFGKVLAVPARRLATCFNNLRAMKPHVKFNGTTGNFAALSLIYPQKDWETVVRGFIDREFENLVYNDCVDQIEPHDWIVRLLSELKLALQVLRDLDTDLWLYLHKGYLSQRTTIYEDAPSAMPNKINPVSFENSEGSIKLAAGIFDALTNELPRNRMQRDLSDSSALRYIGSAFGLSLQAITQALRGLERIVVNVDVMANDLDSHPEVIVEAVQTALRRRGDLKACEKLKEMTRGKSVSLEELRAFVERQSTLTSTDIRTLTYLKPKDFIGKSEAIAKKVVEDLSYLT